MTICIKIEVPPIDVRLHGLHPTSELGELKALVVAIAKSLNQFQEKVMATLDDVVAKVTNMGTVEDSVIALLTDIKAKLDAAGADPAKLQALSDAIDAQTQKLSDAVVANTPAAPTP